jgi:hypothetical protein
MRVTEALKTSNTTGHWWLVVVNVDACDLDDACGRKLMQHQCRHRTINDQFPKTP